MDRVVTDITEAEPGGHSRREAAQGYGEQNPKYNREGHYATERRKAYTQPPAGRGQEG